MMDKTVESLGRGLCRLLCYSYGGFLLVACAACFSHAEIKPILDALHPSLAVLTIIAIGAAIYFLHRTIIMPVHHLLLCYFFWIGDRSRDIAESTPSPTRFLGEGLGVPVRRKIAAYNTLRRSDFFHNKGSLDLAHAENGMLVMTGVGLILAAGYGATHQRSFLLAITLFALGLVFLAASFWAEWIQHSVECFAIKDRPIEAMKILAKTGVLKPEDIEAMIELSELKDQHALEILEEDIARKEQAGDQDTA
jgi:hypothetical protein